MPAIVKLSVISGPADGREFVFKERTTCIAGRAEDCEPRIVEARPPMLVSRHHCLFDINPPDVRVRDFGSLNGTHVNGVEIGRREPGQTPEEGARLKFCERDLFDGDEVRLGRTRLQVSVTVDAPQVSAAAPPEPESPRCTRCGRDVSAEVGQRRGELVCSACRRDPDAIVSDLLNRAKPGRDELAAIRGYELVKQLGRGGQGVVYLARREHSDDLLALKVLFAAVAVEGYAKDCFLREIEITRALAHPNVVASRDNAYTQATFFFASEYCDGGSVDHLMATQGGRLAIDEAVEIALQLLDGLAYAHAAELPVRLADGSLRVCHGVVHRDIKPANILLSGNGSARIAKLADFGLSKAFDSAGLSGLSRSGTLAGTPFFMARQQVVNYKYAKPDVDVWAVAATLYCMLTGAYTRNFSAKVDPISVILRDSPVPIRERDRSIPRRLAAVIDEALVDRPPSGIRTAHELKRALEDAL